MTELTLIVAAPDGADPASFLAALDAVGIHAHPEVETLIVQGWTSPLDQAPRGARLITWPEPASIFALWGEGVRRAEGRYLALLDIRCPIASTWTDAVLKALPTGLPAFFGPVACRWLPHEPGYLGYLVEYAQFHPPLDDNLLEVPGVNLILRQELARHSAVLRQDGFIKTRALSLLAQTNAPAPHPLPDAVVTYGKSYRSGEYSAHRYDHGRCYAAEREFAGSALLRRALAVVATPLLPLLRTARIYRHAARLADGRRSFWRRAANILIAEAGWSIGECLGYLAGEGRCRRRLR